jgi:hypothetical protein
MGKAKQPQYRWNGKRWEVKVGKHWKAYMRPYRREALKAKEVLAAALEAAKSPDGLDRG